MAALKRENVICILAAGLSFPVFPAEMVTERDEAVLPPDSPVKSVISP